MGGYQERIFDNDIEARQEILKAVRSAGGSMSQAAKILGISFRSLSRYVTRLGLRAELKSLRDETKPVKSVEEPTKALDPLVKAAQSGLPKRARSGVPV